MVKHTIQITIVNNSTGTGCDAECGIDWSSAEAIALAKQSIKNRFGDRAQLEYIDLSEATANHDALEWHQAIKNKNLLLPLLLINGQSRISGLFDIRQLLDVIDAEMEIEA